MSLTTKQSAYLVAALLAGALVHPAAAGQQSAHLKRGALLVIVGGCADCHTPFRMGANGPEKDLARGLSGHPESLRLPPPPRLQGEWNWAGSASMTAFVGPWGVTYAANLTPDRETGIGAWTADDFIRAMRTGQHVGVGRPILPPMPVQALASLADSDLRAIHAWLMAQPAVANRVPDYLPPATARSSGRRNPG
jgi:cytochrome c553